MLPDILAGDLYVLGVAVSQTALQVGMVARFALGGIVVAVLHASGALCPRRHHVRRLRRPGPAGVRGRPAAAPSHCHGPGYGRSRRGAAGVRSAGAAHLVLFGWLVTFYIVPMGLAAAHPRPLHPACPRPLATGLVFAAVPSAP